MAETHEDPRYERLTQLARDLTHQYKLTYAIPQTLIPPEKVTVESARKDLEVRGSAPPQSEARRP